MAIWCKCVQKIKQNNVITEYELIDKDENHKIVTREQLLNAMISKKVEITNLKLSKDNKIVDRSLEESIKNERKYFYAITRLDDGDMYTKAVASMSGMAPEVVDGVAIALPNSNDIIITADVKEISYRLNFSNRNVRFVGRNTIREIDVTSPADVAIIQNSALIDSVVNHELNQAVIIIDSCDKSIKLVDAVFKTYKTDTIQDRHYDCKHNIGFNDISIIKINPELMNVEDALSRMRMILKRQKPSGKSERRVYDLIAYIRLMYSMYISYKDERFLEGVNDYINEYNAKVDMCIYHNNDYGMFGRHTSESVQAIIWSITNRTVPDYLL